jgi:polygalacturonase
MGMIAMSSPGRRPRHGLTIACLGAAVLTLGGLSPAFAGRPEINPRDFGATGDGRTKDTVAIQRAIDAAAKVSGTVVLDRGRFLSGTLHLRSGITLRIEPAATLVGSAEHADYEKGGRWLALLEARALTDVAITGGGVIDGQGAALAEDVTRLMRENRLDDPADSKRPGEKNRPQLLEFLDCRRVVVSNITLKNSSCWVQTYVGCDDLTLDHVTVRSTAYWNNDGIDIVDGHRVVVKDCDIDSADDGICLKSYHERSCVDVRIENCRIRSSSNAFKLGTPSHGGFKNIVVRGLKIHDTLRSAIALQSVDGGAIEDVDIGDVEARNTGNGISIRLGHRNREAHPGSIRNVRIHDVSVEVPAAAPDAGYPLAGPPVRAPHNLLPSSIVGLSGHVIRDIAITNLTLSVAGGGRREVAEIPLDRIPLIPECAEKYPEFSMFGELPAWGFYVRHAENITFENVTLQTATRDYRSAFVLDDVRAAILRQVAISPGGENPVIVTHDVTDLQITDTTPPEGTREWLRDIAPAVGTKSP